MNYSSINRFPGGDWDWEDHDEWEDAMQHEQLKSTSAYVDGRNAARDGKSRTDITDLYASDSLAAVNWEVGYDDWIADSQPK